MCGHGCSTIARPIAIAIALTLLAAGSADAADSAGRDKWQFDLALYAWGPTIKGDLGFDIPGSDDSFEVGLDQIIEDLELAGMLGFQARKNRWSAVVDVIYLDLAGTDQSSVPLRIGSGIGAGLQLDVGAQLQLEAWVVQAAGAYDVLQTDRANLGVLFGVRYFSLDADLSLSIDGPLPPELPTTEYSQKGELWDGIVGVKGQYGRKWYIPYYLDLGTGSSDFTWQAMTGFGYRWRWGGVFVVYRYLSFDEGDDGPIQDMSFSGPAVAVNFRF